MGKTTVACIVCAGLALGGCSINEYGVVENSTVSADGDIVYQLAAPGAHLDTRDSDPSVTIGFYTSIYVFPKGCVGASKM